MSSCNFDADGFFFFFFFFLPSQSRTLTGHDVFLLWFLLWHNCIKTAGSGRWGWTSRRCCCGGGAPMPSGWLVMGEGFLSQEVKTEAHHPLPERKENKRKKCREATESNNICSEGFDHSCCSLQKWVTAARDTSNLLQSSESVESLMGLFHRAVNAPSLPPPPPPPLSKPNVLLLRN